MKEVSFKVAKALKEAGYPQNQTDSHYDCFGHLVCYGIAGETGFDIPTYLEVWLWLWREKKIKFIPFSNNKQSTFALIDSDINDPEEAIEAAIVHIVDNDLIK